MALSIDVHLDQSKMASVAAWQAAIHKRKYSLVLPDLFVPMKIEIQRGDEVSVVMNFKPNLQGSTNTISDDQSRR